MLQEPSNDALDLDGFTDTRDAWAQPADSAYDEVDLDSRSRGFVEQLNHAGILKGIHLENHVPVARFLVASHFVPYQFFEPFANTVRGHQPFAVRLLVG